MFQFDFKWKILIKFRINSLNSIFKQFSIKFWIIYYNKVLIIIDKTSLIIASKNENADIVKLLLTHKKLDPNISYRIYNKSFKLHSIHIYLMKL